MTENIIEAALETVEKARSQEVFNLLDVIRDEGFPKDIVSIVIDKRSAYEAYKLEEQLEEIMASDDEVKDSDVAPIREKIASLVKTIDASRHEVHLVGISEGKREELIEQSLEKFPRQYREKSGIIKGVSEEVEIDSPERDEYFTDLLWVNSIEKIVAPDGREQTHLTPETVRELRSELLLPVNAKITTAIEKLRIGTAAFIATTDEDFLVKP